MTSTFIARLSALTLALVVGAASVSAVAYARQQPTPVPTPTLVPAPALAELDMRDADARIETDPFIRTELFFGSERSGKPEVSDIEFKQFLDAQITPRFPDGLTVLKGFGQFRESDGDIVQESSFVLILLYPRETLRDSSAPLDAAIMAVMEGRDDMHSAEQAPRAVMALRERRVDGIILGCTEIPLLHADLDAPNLLNPTALLAEAAVRYAIADP